MKLANMKDARAAGKDSDSDDEGVKRTEIEEKLRSEIQTVQDRMAAGMQAYVDVDTLPQKKQLDMYLKTLKTESKINLAQQTILRINASLKHHILSSEFHSAKDTHGCNLKSKYIDLADGASKDVQILGNVYGRPEGGKLRLADAERPILRKVPLLFRIQDCKFDETYQFTIKQL